MSKSGSNTGISSVQGSSNIAENAATNTTTKAALKDIIRSARALASDRNMSRILELLDKVPELEEEIKSKDSQIEKLNVEMNEKEADHKKTHQRSLSSYVESHEEMRREIVAKGNSITSLQSELIQKDKIESMKRNESNLTDQIENLQNNAKSQREMSKKDEATIKELRNSVATTQAANEKLQVTAQEHDMMLSKSDADLKRYEIQNETLRKEYRQILRQLEDIKSLAEPLHLDDLTSM